MSEKVKILLLEDSAIDADLIGIQIGKAGLDAEVNRVVVREDFERALASGRYDLIISDYSLPDFDGLSALRLAADTTPQTPFILVSGTLGEDIAIDALHNGATDYVLKQRLHKLAPAMERALREKQLRTAEAKTREALQTSQVRFRELADSLPQLIWATDRNFNILYANLHAREYEPWMPATTEGAARLCHRDEVPVLLEKLARSREKATKEEFECRIFNPRKGEYRWHVTQIFPTHDAAQNVMGWVVTAFDIEEQRLREQELRESEQALTATRNSLEEKVKERTVAYSKLSARLLTIQDEERRRLARELHDGFGQQMVALKMNLDSLLTFGDTLPEKKYIQVLEDSCSLLEDCLRQIRNVSYLMHPPLLDESGFAMAARWFIKGFEERSSIRVNLQQPAGLDRLPPDYEVVLFRVMQTAMTNAELHAHATEIAVTLTCDEHEISLEVRDNGTGLSPEKVASFDRGGFDLGVGLAGLRERVRDIGGKLEISGSRGTIVRTVLPTRPRPSGLPQRDSA